METRQRRITIYTADKIYSGDIDVASESLRTLDIFNSSSIYWKNPSERSFEDSLLLNNATVLLDGTTRLGDFPKLQIRLSDILFFHDSLHNLGDSNEQKRAASLKTKTKEETAKTQIITKTQGNTFYFISGIFYGLFKSKSNHRFIPITEVSLTGVVRAESKWKKKKIPIEGGFVGVSTRHIEACSFSEKKIPDAPAGY